MTEQKEKFDLKGRIKAGWHTFTRFFKEFKWDREHVGVLVRFGLEILFFAFIITFDLTMKDFLYDFVEVRHGGHYTAIPGFLDLTYSQNTGMGFGLGKGSTLGITILTFIVIIVILGYLVFFKKEKEYIRIPLIMVAAGGIGNLVDRIGLGYVRDFFEFTFVDFAIFNIADAFVTVGAIMLIISLIVMLFVTSKGKSADDGDGKTDADGGEAEQTESAAPASEEEKTPEERGEEAQNASETAGASETADGERAKASFTVTAQGGDSPEKVAFTVTAENDAPDAAAEDAKKED